MIKKYGSMVFYIAGWDSDVIYNKITDTQENISLYPDIFYTHPFAEKEIVNHQVYLDAVKLLREHGSAHCVFLSVTDSQKLDVFASSVNNVLRNIMPCGGLSSDVPASVQKLCSDLRLSATMTSSLIRLYTYYSTIGNTEALTEYIYNRYPLPVSSKKEGKAIYEDIYRYIVS